MHLFAQIHAYMLSDVVPAVADASVVTEEIKEQITVELPRERHHGDVATNAAMVLAKPLRTPPRTLAETMVTRLEALRHVKRVEIAGPGFINIMFHPFFWQDEVLRILRQGQHYGDSEMGQSQQVNIEYVSANPTGPLHIGHARGAVVGDALARLLTKASYEVTKEYYVNDAGAQVETLARSAYQRYLETYGQRVTFEEGMYPGDYLKPVGEALKAQYGGTLLDDGSESGDDSSDAHDASDAQPPWLEDVQSFAVEAMMERIRDDLAQLGVVHDVFTSERELHANGWLARGMQTLKRKGLLYEGMLDPPKGKAPEDWEPAWQLLFRATAFGDESDRPVRKADGSYTYLAGDIAYACHKLARGFTALVMVLGADHAGYVTRLQALVRALSTSDEHGAERPGEVELSVQLCQLVKLMQAGEPVKMSKRAGSFLTVREVAEEVGPDVLRFIMLTRRPEQALEVDLEQLKQQSKDNPVFYVQYAHARCHSVMGLAEEQTPESARRCMVSEQVDVSLLDAPDELRLIRLLASFPRQVEAAARACEPHRIAYYLQELAAEFHALWNKGASHPDLRLIHAQRPEVTTARLALVRSVMTVLAAGLGIIGVEPIREMR